MNSNALRAILGRTDISRCECIVPQHVYRHTYRTRITREKGFKWMNIDVLIITDSELNKKSIIYNMGNDLHWYTLKKYRDQHVLSGALKTGCIKKVWPDLKSITCLHDDDVTEYNKAAHLAELAGLSLRDRDENECSICV